MIQEIKNDLDKYSYENKIKVILGEKILFISPLELQIAYKLFLAAEGLEKELQSDKDIEMQSIFTLRLRKRLIKNWFQPVRWLASRLS